MPYFIALYPKHFGRPTILPFTKAHSRKRHNGHMSWTMDQLAINERLNVYDIAGVIRNHVENLVLAFGSCSLCR